MPAPKPAPVTPDKNKLGPLPRLAIHTFIGTRARRGRGKEKAAALAVLKDDDLFDSVIDSSVKMYAEATHGGPLQNLLQWFIDNWETILKVLLTILAL